MEQLKAMHDALPSLVALMQTNGNLTEKDLDDAGSPPSDGSDHRSMPKDHWDSAV